MTGNATCNTAMFKFFEYQYRDEPRELDQHPLPLLCHVFSRAQYVEVDGVRQGKRPNLYMCDRNSRGLS